MAYFSTGAALSAALSELPASLTGTYKAFDAFYYAEQYMGNYSGTLAPIEHFVQIGAARGFKPNANFDPKFYQSSYEDLAGLDGADLLFHYVKFGLNEGRAGNATLAAYNWASYLDAYPAVKDYVSANLSSFGGSMTNGAIAHYVKFGAQQGFTLPNAAGQTFTLTSGVDALSGTSGNDTFTATVGANLDTLQSDDVINGGAGTDTLEATLANTPFAITPRSTSLEVLKVRSQADGYAQGTNDVSDNVYVAPGVDTRGDNTIDAQNMVGTKEFWSTNSRADLVIEDVRHNSHETTLGLQSTDPGDVDYAVFFDPSHITAPGDTASGASLTVRLADVLGLKENNNGLKNLPYSSMTIALGSKEVVLDIDFSKLKGYADFATAINAALTKAGITTVTATTAGAESAYFSTAVNAYQEREFAGQFNPVVLSNSGPEAITLKGYGLSTGAQEPNGNLVRTYTVNEQSAVPSLKQVNMILDDVGRGSMAGDFLAGSMSTGRSGSKGIQQFNVSVDRNSHITTLQSTSNALEVVNVKNIGANGNLRLDNAQLTDDKFGLTDVRVFDASAMTGKVTLSANLTKEVVGKYMDLVDTKAPEADNADPVSYRDVVDQEFSYDLGKGNDSLYLVIDKANLEAAGTTSREDFNLVVNGNAGDDNVTVKIDHLPWEGQGNEAWYTNSTLNANLSVNGGDGNDTINTVGAGNWKISAGAGNDTVYSNNSGEKAVWVFNTANQADASAEARKLNNLVSDANETYALYKSTLTVNFRGLTATADIAGTTANKYKTNDLLINQAIKKAINRDPVLSKLLIAKDGPANTLIVTSLIDGETSVADLSLTIKAPTKLSETDLTESGTTLAAMATLANSLTAAGKDYAAAFAIDVFGNDYSGSDNNHAVDSTHNLGAGNDVLVLNTNHDGVLATSSNETVVYNAIDFGNDTIVNFNAGTDDAPTVVDAGEDKLNFIALGGKNFIGTADVGATDVNVIAVRSQVAKTLDDATDVAALFKGTTNEKAQTHIVVLVDANNVGTVYQVNDVVGAKDSTAAVIGTIDLADTDWLTLSADNFA